MALAVDDGWEHEDVMIGGIGQVRLTGTADILLATAIRGLCRVNGRRVDFHAQARMRGGLAEIESLAAGAPLGHARPRDEDIDDLRELLVEGLREWSGDPEAAGMLRRNALPRGGVRDLDAERDGLLRLLAGPPETVAEAQRLVADLAEVERLIAERRNA